MDMTLFSHILLPSHSLLSLHDNLGGGEATLGLTPSSLFPALGPTRQQTYMCICVLCEVCALIDFTLIPVTNFTRITLACVFMCRWFLHVVYVCVFYTLLMCVHVICMCMWYACHVCIVYMYFVWVCAYDMRVTCVLCTCILCGCVHVFFFPKNILSISY